MSQPIPFYERTLDSFSDHIITKARLEGMGHGMQFLT